MKIERNAMTILMAEDDEDDRLLTIEAFREAEISANLHFVEDGEELMDYLCQRGLYDKPNNAPRPAFILLDLNMPKKDGRDVLNEIKSHELLKQIPVIILTTSQDQEDIALSYHLGANSFIAKPNSFEELVRIFRTLGDYWFSTVKLPF